MRPPPESVDDVYLTRGRQLFPFRTHRSTRWVVEKIFRGSEYPLLDLPGWRPEVVVDVGANAGAFAVYAHSCFPQARLFAFEPVAANYRLLEHNLQVIDGAVAVHAGLVDRDSRARIYYGRNNSGECSLRRGPNQRDDGEEVELRRASTELARLGVDAIGILKIDTEGSEVAILGDLRELLSQVDVLFVEYHRAGDRLSIDRLLDGTHALYSADIHGLGAGVLRYVRRALVAERAPQMLDG